MSDATLLLPIANTAFARLLRLVTTADWERPTPCDGWDVRALVNHVIGANRRHTMLLHGASAEDTDATRSVDHLGADPIGSFVSTSAELLAAFAEECAPARTAHHPAGDRSGADLLGMRLLDVAIHSWDLARAIGADETIEPDIVEYLLTLSPDFEGSRQRGAFGPRVADASPATSPQARLLHLLGRPTPMTEADLFLESTLPRLMEADTALHNGDASLRNAIWSHNEPLTLLGAKMSASGWADIGPVFEQLAARFSNCQAADWDVLAAGASGDLAYVVCIEHTTTSVGGGDPVPYSLRATTILRREDGEWKVVHRHADPYDASSQGPLAKLLT